MNLFEVISRYGSADRFSSRQVGKDKIRRLLQTSRLGSRMAKQLVPRVILVSEEERRRQIREAAERTERAYHKGVHPSGRDDGKEGNGWEMPFLEEAPHLLVICSRTSQPFMAAATWIGIGHLILAANQEGLCARCYAPALPTFLNRILDIPAQMMPVAVLAIGYSADGLFPTLDPEQQARLKGFIDGRYVWRMK